MMRRSRSRDGVALPPPPPAAGESSGACGNTGNSTTTNSAAEGGKILSLRLGDLVCVTQETKGENGTEEEELKKGNTEEESVFKSALGIWSFLAEALKVETK